MESKKQTAVEWLCNEWLYIDQEFDLMLIDKKIYWEKLRAIQEQAKAMEEEQKNNLPIYIHEGISNTHVYIEDGVVHVKQNETIKSE